jgi:hypothetical protein
MSSSKNLNCTGFIVSLHCQKAIDLRNIFLDDVIETVEYGEIIATYNNDKPFPSKLILKFVTGNPLHVVVSQNPDSLECILITAYEPDENIWEANFKFKLNK